MKSEAIALLLAIGLNLAGCASSQKKPVALENEKNPQYQYELAVTAMKYGLADEAIQYLNQAVALDPAHYLAHFMLGDIYAQRKNYGDAAAAFERCLELKPDYSDTNTRLGYVYEEMGLLDKAEGPYLRAYAQKATLEACLNLARLYYRQNKLGPALEFGQRALGHDNRSIAAHNLLGVVLNELRRYPEAIQSFQNVLAIEPANVVAGINLAAAFINNSNLKEARELLLKLLPLAKEEALKERISQMLEKIK